MKRTERYGGTRKRYSDDGLWPVLLVNVTKIKPGG